MAERDDSEKPSSEIPGSDKPASKAAAEALPSVEAPPLSPATSDEETVLERKAPAEESKAPAEPSLPRLSPALRRWWAPGGMAAALLLGTAIGALATGYLATPRSDAGSPAERQAIQQSIARLSHELGTLKADLANAGKSARAQSAQLAKLNDTLSEPLARDAAVVTASIAPPQTMSTASAPVQVSAPLPPPRPTAQIAAHTENRNARISGWSVLGARGGFVYVRSGREIFRVAPGARLPGLGLVEEVRRQDGEWVIVTPRGLIVAERARRFYDYDEPY